MDALTDAIDHHPCADHLTKTAPDPIPPTPPTWHVAAVRVFPIQRPTRMCRAPVRGMRATSKTARTRETRACVKEVDEEHLDDLAQSQSPPGDLAQFDEPPHEGDFQVRRPPGVRAGRYPDIDIIVTATLDQLAQARHAAAGASGQPILDGFDGFDRPDGSAEKFTAGLAARFKGGFARAQHGGGVHPPPWRCSRAT